jgi:hypothetical protein
MSEYEEAFSKKSTSSSRKKDVAGEEMVRCRGCLGQAIRYGNLSRHLKKEHKDYYKANKDK